MKAYAVGQITIKDPAKREENRKKIPATLALWGAEFVLRGDTGEGAERAAPAHRYYRDPFPDLASVVKWHASPAYQPLVPLRKEAADVDLISYESDP